MISVAIPLWLIVIMLFQISYRLKALGAIIGATLTDEQFKKLEEIIKEMK